MKAHLAVFIGIPVLLFVVTGTTLAQDTPLSPDDPLPHALYLPLAAAPIRGSAFIELGAPDDLAVVGEPYSSTVPLNQYLDAYWVTGFRLAADAPFGSSSPEIGADGVVTWLPRAGDVGIHHYRLTAIVNDGTTVDRAIAIEVAPRTPIISATVGSEGGTLTDPGGDYQVVIPPNAVAEDAAGVQVEVNAVKRADGRALVTRSLGGLNPAVTAIYTEPLFAVQTDPATFAQPGVQAPAECKELPFIAAFNPAPQTNGGYVPWAHLSILENYSPIEQNMPFVLPFKGRVPSYKYAATDGKGLTELRGACATNCMGKQPVLFVHGYAQWGNLGGGTDTWGCGFKYIEGLGGLPYEFRWRGNTRFEEVAYYLGQAIAQVTELTGRKPLLVGHSMGGILISTYLAGLAEMPDATAKKLVQVGYDSPPVRGARHAAAAARVITVGSPLSGISSAGEAALNQLPQGRDAHLTGGSMLVCDDLTCGQSGTRTTRNTYPGWFTTQQKVKDFRTMFGVPLEAPGTLIHRLFDAWRGTTVTNTIPSSIHFDVLVSAWYLLGTPGWSDAEWGDGLIAVTGMQAVPGHLLGETPSGGHYNFIRTLGRTLTPEEKGLAQIPPNLDYTFMMTVTQNPALFGYPHGRYFNDIANYWWWVMYGAANPNAAAQDYPLGGTVQFAGRSFDHALRPVFDRNFALALQEAPVFTSTTAPAAIVISGTLMAAAAPGQQMQPLGSEPILVVFSVHGVYQGAVQVATDASGSWRLDLGAALAPYGITTTEGLEVIVRMGNDTRRDAETLVLDAAQLDTAKDVGVFALPAR